MVHVISQLWKGAERRLERQHEGRLLIHRVPCERAGRFGLRPHRKLTDPDARALFVSSHHAQAFAWTCAPLIERLVEEEEIDVVEAPEYEAPLYFYQLRRGLGYGPARKPPCVIHLHSPTELIARHNDWDVGHPYFLTAKRLEDFSMSAADALLCPSRYLAEEIHGRSDLRSEPPHIIHYPAPAWDAPQDAGAPRDGGSIVYVGRLERRKGVVEWVEAAVEAARLRPQARFEFVGRPVLDTDWRESRDVLRGLVPAELSDRFRFHGSRSRGEVREILAGARLAVVPSRWDNFPNTCIEAMSMGLPVLVTPAGGMVQLVEEGVSGWLAASSGASDLRAALLRALDTPETRLREMGRRALESVRTGCDPARIVEAHLEFKRALVAAGPKRSLGLPPVLATSGRVGAHVAAAAGEGAAEIGAVVVCPARVRPDKCLSALAAQTIPPAVTVLVRYGSPEADALATSGPVVPGLQVLDGVQRHRAGAIERGLEALRALSPSPEGVVVLDEHDILGPRHLQRCGGVLGRRPEVGLVSFWERTAGRVVMPPCPSRPYQWLWNDAASASVIRVRALEHLDEMPVLEDPLYDRWYLANSVVASGWTCVTIPELLAERITPRCWVNRLDSSRMVQAIHDPFQDRIAEDAPALVLLARSGAAGTLRERAFRPREFGELAASLAGSWRRAIGWGWTKVMVRMGRG